MQLSLVSLFHRCYAFFFFNDTPTTEIYTLSLHDALPISKRRWMRRNIHARRRNFFPLATSSVRVSQGDFPADSPSRSRSEEHTSELQSRVDLVCRLLLEKKKKKKVMLHNI